VIVFDILRRRVVLEVIVVETLVDEPDVTVAFLVVETLLDLPVVLRKGLGEADVEPEVRELLLDVAEVIHVEELLPGTTAVPVGHLPGGLFRLEQVENMSTEGSHTGTATDIDHFAVGRVDVELPVRTRDRNLVARLPGEDVGRANPGVHVHPAIVGAIPGRSGDT